MHRALFESLGDLWLEFIGRLDAKFFRNRIRSGLQAMATPVGCATHLVHTEVAN